MIPGGEEIPSRGAKEEVIIIIQETDPHCPPTPFAQSGQDLLTKPLKRLLSILQCIAFRFVS